jgi:hypothetical protein
MIGMRFCVCPQILWITLWANPATITQSLDSAWLALACSFCWQAHDLNEINNLAQIRANPDGPMRGVHAVAAQHVSWG